MKFAFLGIEDPVLIAAVVAFLTAVATSPLTFLVQRALLRQKAKTDYEFEQRRELRSLIGRYHGRMLEAAGSFQHRLFNLYVNVGEGWLNVKGDYRPEQFYFFSTVYRFMALHRLAAGFEREAIFIDSRIAEPADRCFLYYAKALRWAMTDVAVFRGLDYDRSVSADHFFGDQLRHMSASIWLDGEAQFDFAQFEDAVASIRDLVAAMEFFDGVSPNEGRLRWDRLVGFHLLLAGFINAYGYPMQRLERDSFDAIAAQLRHPEVASNLRDWLPRLGLSRQREARLIRQALERRLA